MKTETDSCRSHLARWCIGNGLDIGHGGAEPIIPAAICIDLPVGDPRRAQYGDTWPTHLCLDAFRPLPFKDDSLDYVFSSHCLEDALDTAGVLKEWCRVIRPGGWLVLFLPDQPAYEAFCATEGSLPNQAHKHPEFSLDFVIEHLPDLMEIDAACSRVGYNPYSFSLVAKKLLA